MTHTILRLFRQRKSWKTSQTFSPRGFLPIIYPAGLSELKFNFCKP